jgi:hypothetical protein
VNYQQHMHQALQTIKNKSNSRFTVKEGIINFIQASDMNHDITKLWDSISNLVLS